MNQVFSATDSDDEQELVREPPEFYDPVVDDKDENWANSQRKGRQSDAILSCPGCFTTLCMDCQRHEIFVTQYRAMFVMNCRVCHDEVPDTSVKPSKNNKQQQQQREQEQKPGKRKRAGDVGGSAAPRIVRCGVCDTQVGVIDGDEIYHFLTAIPSYS